MSSVFGGGVLVVVVEGGAGDGGAKRCIKAHDLTADNRAFKSTEEAICLRADVEKRLDGWMMMMMSRGGGEQRGAAHM